MQAEMVDRLLFEAAHHSWINVRLRSLKYNKY